MGSPFDLPPSVDDPTTSNDPHASPRAPRPVPEYIQQSALLSRTYAAIEPSQQGIEQVTTDLEAASTTVRGLQEQISVIRAVESAMERISTKDTKEHDLRTLLVTLADGRQMTATAALEEAGLASNFPGAKATLRQTAKVAESLSEQANAANQQTSMQMIRLQELMHQKNLFLQLATNMAASEEQITRRIAENIR